MASLKMVNGKTYACPAIFGPNKVITKNEIVEVPDDKAESLLSASFFDASNNEHFYFSLEENALKKTRRRTTKE